MSDLPMHMCAMPKKPAVLTISCQTIVQLSFLATCQEGLLNYLTEKCSYEFNHHVAGVKQNPKAMHKMDTIATESTARSAKLMDKQLSEVRAYARNVAKLDMELNKTTLKQLEREQSHHLARTSIMAKVN
jgi:hypothetical protein